MPMTPNEIAEAVQKHAVINYEVSGWDYIVECWTRDEIAQEIESAKIVTVQEGIEFFALSAKLFNDRRKDVEAEIF